MARDAPVKSAAMPTSAAMRGSSPAQGKRWVRPSPSAAPKPPPTVKRGASVPPEVPLPSATAQEMNFATHSATTAQPTMRPERMSVMLS